jgi:predicted metalloprotease
LNNAQQFYTEGRIEEALEEAELASNSAQEAETKAGAAVGGRTYRNYGVIAAVVVVIVVALVLLAMKWKKKRGVY